MSDPFQTSYAALANPDGTSSGITTQALAAALDQSDLAGLSYNSLLQQLTKDLPQYLSAVSVGSAVTTPLVGGSWLNPTAQALTAGSPIQHIIYTTPWPTGTQYLSGPNPAGYFVAPNVGWYLFNFHQTFAAATIGAAYFSLINSANAEVHQLRNFSGTTAGQTVDLTGVTRCNAGDQLGLGVGNVGAASTLFAANNPVYGRMTVAMLGS